MVTELLLKSLRSSWTSVAETDKPEIGILAFEVAGLMLKVVNLWHRLSEGEIFRLWKEIINSIGITRLVSEDNDYLMELVMNELIENLGYIAMSVVRLGKRSTNPIYHQLEQFYKDPIQNYCQWIGWEYRCKKMEKKVKKMERFVAITTQLSEELEVLAELEQTLRRIQVNAASNRVKLLEFQQKVMRQRQEVKNLRQMSPWVRTYDYIVRILARSLFTILERMKHVFGVNQMDCMEGGNRLQHKSKDCLPRSQSFSILSNPLVHPSQSNISGFFSDVLERSISKPAIHAHKMNTNYKQQEDQRSSLLLGKHSYSKSKRLASFETFKGFMMAGSNSPIVQSCKPSVGGSMRLPPTYTKTVDRVDETNVGHIAGNWIYCKLFVFNMKSKLLNARVTTLGGASLDLQYANVIILIEKLGSSPHLIGLGARDDLYNKLPTNIRNSLRARLKSHTKKIASPVNNPALAVVWKLALENILDWLAPLAHNTMMWHSERNIEKQHEVARSNVLLVQTLYYANQAKTEAAITELLVGLNYLFRIVQFNERELVDTTSNLPCDDSVLKMDRGLGCVGLITERQ